ncbi:MAG: hypothetical protein P1S60_09955, partial [Anaerolineae bacterium]|nr:hypothetical protein [Anaerolineae bacterium]
GSLVLTSMEKKNWGDTSLGCPEPGFVYAQVVTPGWQFTYTNSDGENIVVHTGQSIENYVICDMQSSDDGTGSGEMSENDELLTAATVFLAESLNIDPDHVSVISMSKRNWPNSCLGCAGEEENCLMVITSGYQVILEVDHREYAVHTNQTGTALRLCDKNTPVGTDGLK